MAEQQRLGYSVRGSATAGLRHLAKAFVGYHAHAPFRIRAIAWLGAVSLPAYYFIWTYLFPQPYENLWLRTIGTLLCLALALSPYWPKLLQSYYYPFVYGVLIFILPMFFTFMLLMNGLSTSWQMSTIIALLFVALLFDTANMVVAVLIGVALGYAGFSVFHEGPPLTWRQLETVPVFVFSLAAIRILLSFNDHFVAEEKMRAARTLAGHIAHEMRTPLLGIQLDAGRARDYLPILADALRYACEHGWTGKVMRSGQIDLLGQSMDRIREHATSAGLIIDILLLNARHDSINRNGFKTVSVIATLNRAIDRFHFRPQERGKVHIESARDFNVHCSDVMLVHVFFNLLKNALRAVEPDPAGQVRISIDRNRAGEGTIVVADTGSGIPQELLNDLFTAFRTTSEAGTGSGLGLAFCKLVVDSCGGRIAAGTAPGFGAVFTLSFPVAGVPDAPAADQAGRSPAANLAPMASTTGSNSATVSTT